MEKIIISCLESRVETNRSIYARFLVGPFKDDQAVTIATALRRSLLSQVKGIAITAIHIQGVTHEFSTIVGVRESVLDLALNFQQVILRLQSDKRKNVFNDSKEKSAILKSPVPSKTRVGLDRIQRYHLDKSSTLPGSKALQTGSEQNRLCKASLCNGLRFCYRFATVSALYTKQSFLKPKRPMLFDSFIFPLYTGSLNQVAFDRDSVTPVNETVKIGYLQIQGPKVVYANDLKLPAGVECVDPTQYIATVSTEGLLVVKFIIGEKAVSFEKDKEKLIVNLSPDTGNGYHNITPTPLLSRSFNKSSFTSSQRNLSNYGSSFCKSVFKKRSYTQARMQSFALLSKQSLVRPSFLLPALYAVPKHNKTGSLQSPAALQNRPRFCYGGFAKRNLTRAFASTNLSNFKRNDSTIGLRNTIFLDPIFDSVFKVSYLIEKDDLFNQPRERILLELWTNGSIHPRQALHKASLSLLSTFSTFRNVFHLDSL